ncbi:MAG: serine/threonine protein kinase, partial [Thermoanaerobaculia bacterium]|nr:serine/threonine protein kinase [Thermoanaerobaculia bacterium]
MEFTPGTRFGGYEILGELGAGGMGRVLRARDLALDRVVAIKVLASELSRDTAFVQRFQREARAVASLSHPNIVQIFAVGNLDGVHYLAMEYLDGQSLGRYLKNGHWPEADAILIARQVCQALQVAHAAGIVHRDVKPDNLILTRRGEVKVVDLGIAKRVDEDQSMTQSGSAVGTPHYISPEQVQGRRDIDGRADIYSLGATLYHLATGHTPYTGSS